MRNISVKLFSIWTRHSGDVIYSFRDISTPLQLWQLLFGGACADPESFVRGGPTLTCFFSVDEGR